MSCRDLEYVFHDSETDGEDHAHSEEHVYPCQNLSLSWDQDQPKWEDYSGPHCLDRKRAFLRYTLSGHPDRDTLAARLVCWLALVCRPDSRYIPFAG